MTELTNTRQWKDEPVLDYIDHWRSLSLECKDRQTDVSTIKICAHGMEWDLLYVLRMSKPRTFQELATKAHDIEMTIASCRSKPSSLSDSRKDKGEFKKNPKSSNKESMAASVGEPVRIFGKPKYENKKKWVRQGYWKEASHVEGTVGEEISLPWLRFVRNARQSHSKWGYRASRIKMPCRS